MAGAAFGDLGVLLCVAGVSLFVAGAVFGDLGASLFVAGAVFGEIWVDSRSAKFSIQNALPRGCESFCVAGAAFGDVGG